MTRRTLALSAIALFCTTLTAYAGAPLKGVDVKLGKNPGGSPVNRVTSDGSGKAAFGVVPAGSYLVELSMPSQSDEADVEITGVVGGTVKKRWNFKESKAYDVNGASTARASGQPNITFGTDGKTPLQVTIVRSKSNITNN